MGWRVFTLFSPTPSPYSLGFLLREECIPICNEAWLRTRLSQSVWHSLEQWCFCRGEGWLRGGALS